MHHAKEIKCIVWDLDNTIWDGVLAESDNVRLKPGIQEVLSALDARGILHSVASKNNHDDAWDKLKAFNIDHFFLYPEINWNAKSHSVASIQKNLNFAIDTIAFIDDQRFELDEVSSVHPEILPVDATEYLRLPEFQPFTPRFITEDSRRRRLMYLDDITRKTVEAQYKGPQEEFLRSLDMQFVISEACEEDLKRAEELTIRTNQLNATGRTYDYEELRQMMMSDDYKLLVCELTDKYGSYGKIGLALIETGADVWHLRLLLMSCRVISRGVGTVLLTYIMQEAKRNNRRLLTDFKQTTKNKMMFVTLKLSNFSEIAEEQDYTVLENDLSIIQQFPDYIKVTYNKQ